MNSRGEDYALGFAGAFFALFPVPAFVLVTGFLAAVGFAFGADFFAAVFGAGGLFISSTGADVEVFTASSFVSDTLVLAGALAASGIVVSVSSFWSFSPHSTSFEPTRLANGLHLLRIKGTVATAMTKRPAFPGGTIGRGRIVIRLTQVANFGCVPRSNGSMPID